MAVLLNHILLLGHCVLFNLKLSMCLRLIYIPSISDFIKEIWKRSIHSFDPTIDLIFSWKSNSCKPISNLSLNKKDNLEKRGLVYGIKCLACGDNYKYIGETSRNLGDRRYEHEHNKNGPVYNHMFNVGHRTIDFHIITFENNTYVRKIIEMMFIEKEKPVWNTKCNLESMLSMEFKKFM